MGVTAIRIDARLIHGQVATLWQGVWNCDRIMVIDEKSANDPVLKSVLRIACPGAVRLSVLEAGKAAANLKSGKYGSEKIVIVTKTPDQLVTLLDAGFEPGCEVTVGNMSAGEGKKRVTSNISVTEEDAKAFHRLADAGWKIVEQMVPTVAAQEFMPLLEAAEK
jgi:PTS system mannose-specific IIB component